MAAGHVVTSETYKAPTSASPEGVITTIKELVRQQASRGGELVASSKSTATVRAPFHYGGEVGSADMKFAA